MNLPLRLRNVRNQFRGCSCVFRWCSWIFHGVFVALSQTVSNVLAIRSQRNGRPSAAVGADLSCPHIGIHPQNRKRKCACDDVKIRIQLCENTYLVMRICVIGYVRIRAR